MDLGKDKSIMNFCYRDELSERRKNMVLKAFSMMDKSGDGIISASDVINIFDVSRNPDYLEQRLDK